jgi:hypothetical protein
MTVTGNETAIVDMHIMYSHLQMSMLSLSLFLSVQRFQVKIDGAQLDGNKS